MAGDRIYSVESVQVDREICGPEIGSAVVCKPAVAHEASQPPARTFGSCRTPGSEPNNRLSSLESQYLPRGKSRAHLRAENPAVLTSFIAQRRLRRHHIAMPAFSILRTLAILILLALPVLSGKPTGAPVPLRKLVPASSPSFSFEGRWILPPSNSTNATGRYPFIKAFNASEISDLGARGFQSVLSFRVAIKGTKSVSLHYGGQGPKKIAYWRILPLKANWTTAHVAPNVVLTASLDPSKTYEVQVVHSRLFTVPGGFTFLGVGVDAAVGAEAVAVPRRNRTIEFIGDSITTLVFNDKGSLASIPLTACEVLNATCSVVSQAGAKLVGVGSQPGMADTFFKAWTPFALAKGESGPPSWEFGRFVPDAVVINLGTNDRNWFRMTVNASAVFVETYRTLLNRIQSTYGTQTVIYVLVPFGGQYVTGEWSPVIPTALFTTVVKQANSSNIRLLDTTGWVNATNMNTLFYDRRHPNAAGAATFGQRIADVLRGAVKRLS